MFLDEWNRNFFELANISTRYRLILIGIILLNFIVSIIVEYTISHIFARWWFGDKLKESECINKGKCMTNTKKESNIIMKIVS